MGPALDETKRPARGDTLAVVDGALLTISHEIEIIKPKDGKIISTKYFNYGAHDLIGDLGTIVSVFTDDVYGLNER